MDFFSGRKKMVLGEINKEWPIDEEIPSFRPYQHDQVVKLNEFVRRLSEGKEATKYTFPECAFGAAAIRDVIMSHMRERRRKVKDTEFQKGATFSDTGASSGDTESVYESSSSSSNSPPSSQFHKKKIYAEYFNPSKYQVSDYVLSIYSQLFNIDTARNISNCSHQQLFCLKKKIKESV